MSAGTEAPARFTLRVPPSWTQFEIGTARRTGDITRIVDDHLARLPELRRHRREVLTAVRRLAQEAEQAGAVTCAAAVEDDGSLLASLVVFVTDGMPEPALNTVSAIAAQLPSIARPSAGTGRDADWREVRLVALPSGEAVQVRAISTLEAQTADRSIRVVSLETLVPMPGRNQIVNVVLTSPQLKLADDLLDLFAHITQTLDWVGSPAPT